MKISKITLYNFRIYKGLNDIDFSPSSEGNISIIAGKNGFGKTTLLTSLLWAFYGKLMGQVENKYRLDIKYSGGYQPFLESLLNREIENQSDESKKVFYVDIKLEELAIPSLPCNSISIRRSYNLENNSEKLSILIDGIENELTKEVGYDLFINDFILPREIAKFFFFDAEKIVSLAEAKSKEELRSLNRAYSEVLGIKKYEELKKNLVSLSSKLLRKGISEIEKNQLDELLERERESSKLLEFNSEQQQINIEELSSLKAKSNSIQEKLIREGNTITLDELILLKQEQNTLKKESDQIKAELSSLLELAPLVIAGKKLVQLKNQLENEHENSSIPNGLLNKELILFSKEITEKFQKSDLSNTSIIEKIIKESLKTRFENESNPIEVLIAIGEEGYRDFQALYLNLKSSFSSQLKSIVQQEKNNRVLFFRVSSKIKQAEARKDNHLAKKFRDEKAQIEKMIEELKTKENSLLIEQGALSAKNNSDKKLVSELETKFKLVDSDNKKYQTTENLLERINSLILKIKQEKKYALQKALKLSLNKLMHKDNFINEVKIQIDEDIMNIDLYDSNKQIIRKETLSKGEQQLYATALLKALVDESGITFPVFIDSPLQKFDKYHSKSIIEEFYPVISNQVVLLPLLEKELSKREYDLLKPNLHKSFLIDNLDHNASKILEADLEEVFDELNSEAYV
ncbi:hypothetical protein IMCC3317_21140 [Kordia antarctica]|uniref:Rad50/SbcC-type AAA domain-containing protein n=1 Tax=Kordia antarctica TaxID=1218801 RepID=A0A7L4ZLC6_9FLAO|nr:AAA family ATPase [Kordia antarctica]QHI36744.1 hypothetical protein IMCC3317_21140 [Kordia antarctica]